MTYGWSAERILGHYGQYINAVHQVMPKGLRKPGPDTLNVPKQCFEFVNDVLGCEEFLRRALGKEEPLSDMEFTAWWDIVDEFKAYLKENPWEPEDRMAKNPPIYEDFYSIIAVSVATGVPERTLSRWASEQAMPHERRGRNRKIYIQLHVAEKWKDMKFRHRTRKHAIKRSAKKRV
jgi:hypothetical protein